MAFKRILCAVDFSEESLEAFQKAVELASQSSARLFVLHALEAQPVISQWLEEDRLGEVTVAMERKARQSLNSLLDSHRAELEKISVHSEIASGRAFVEILENARVWNADLIVLGSRGASALDRLLVGSTAERVMKDAECSVLVARP